MPSKALALFLIALLAAPFNGAAAAWMAVSMPVSDHGMAADAGPQANSSHDFQLHHTAMPSDQAAGHEHGQEENDCESHCVSCINHCSSLVAVSADHVGFERKGHLPGAEAGTARHHSELLYRPPIHR